MSELDKKGFIIFSIVVLFFFALGWATCYFIGGTNTRTHPRTQRQLEDARRVNAELRAEQLRDAERNRRAIELAEGIRGISEETDRIIGELRVANRRSGDILKAIEQEVDVLENYLRFTSSIVDDYFNTVYGDEVE